jgi:hypothetical protein
MTVQKKIFYPKNSQYFEIDGLKDNSVTPAVYLNSATTTATLKDPSGIAVAGFTSVTGTYVTASNGVYQFAVDPTTFNPTTGGGYILVIDATQGGKAFHIEVPAKIAFRQVGTESSN